MLIRALPLLLAAMAAASVPASARATDAPLSAEAFEALTTGRTFFYESGGTAYGAEQYLPGRRVIWAFTGDDCRRGEWYADGPWICLPTRTRPSRSAGRFTRRPAA